MFTIKSCASWAKRAQPMDGNSFHLHFGTHLDGLLTAEHGSQIRLVHKIWTMPVRLRAFCCANRRRCLKFVCTGWLALRNNDSKRTIVANDSLGFGG
jgi:hypothetical protein